MAMRVPMDGGRVSRVAFLAPDLFAVYDENVPVLLAVDVTVINHHHDLLPGHSDRPGSGPLRQLPRRRVHMRA